MPSPPRTIAVIAPHPDDEAIFSGGSIVALAAAGHRVVVIAATTGDTGSHSSSLGSGTPGSRAGSAGRLARVRAQELEAAAAILGVDAVHHLGFGDSGLVATPALQTPALQTPTLQTPALQTPARQRPATGAFTAVAVDRAAERLATVLSHEGVTDVICDPLGGIYAHPDHRHAHDVTMAAVKAAGIVHVHAVTVDREHLHFVETHLVANAHDALAESAPGAPTGFGAPTVEIDIAVILDEATITIKRQAMAAHASQMPANSAVMGLGDNSFASVYGMEWYCRVIGPAGAGAVDDLVARSSIRGR